MPTIQEQNLNGVCLKRLKFVEAVESQGVKMVDHLEVVHLVVVVVIGGTTGGEENKLILP